MGNLKISKLIMHRQWNERIYLKNSDATYCTLNYKKI